MRKAPRQEVIAMEIPTAISMLAKSFVVVVTCPRLKIRHIRVMAGVPSTKAIDHIFSIATIKARERLFQMVL